MHIATKPTDVFHAILRECDISWVKIGTRAPTTSPRLPDVLGGRGAAVTMALAIPPAVDKKRVKVYELRNNDWFDRGTGFCLALSVNVRASRYWLALRTCGVWHSWNSTLTFYTE